MLRRCLLFLIAGLALLFASISCAAENQQPDAIHFLTLSDIHFDPFQACHQKKPCPLIEKLRKAPASQWPAILAVYDTDAPRFRQDTGYPLLRTTLAASQKEAMSKRVSFVIVLGDFLGHDYRTYYSDYTSDNSRAGFSAFVNKTMTFLTNELARAFPGLNVYQVVGNNDTYSWDYIMQPRGAFFKETGAIWATLIQNKTARADFMDIFPVGGYYALDIPGQSAVRLIVLNTVLFSTKTRGKGVDAAALLELNWLHDQLALAQKNKQKVFIAMHIPAGIDIYASLHYRLFRMIEFWKREYTERFEFELKTFAPEIAGIFAGHLHTDWFQMLTLSNANTVPVSGTPSISPIFSNNPGYKIYTYSPSTGQIEDFETYYYAIDHQRADNRANYNFASYYHKFFYTPNVDREPAATVWRPYY